MIFLGQGEERRGLFLYLTPPLTLPVIRSRLLTVSNGYYEFSRRSLLTSFDLISLLSSQ